LTPLEIAGLTIFIVILFFGLFITVFGLPGTAVILIDVIIYAAVTGFEKISLTVIFILLLISLTAEVLDFALGMAGASKFGSSVGGMWASAAGSIIGAMILAPLLFGLGAVIGFFFGGFAGALIVELIRQNRLKPAFRAAWGTVLGRFAGICAKGLFAIAMIIITLSNIYS
jgi:uncharacterized protein YqgC (DUF456 family)